MVAEQTEVISKRIKGLADRGVFQGCEKSVGRGGRLLIRFRWLLGREFSIGFDPEGQKITMKNVLPNIENRSYIDRDLRKFIAKKSEGNSAAHRHVDANKSELTYKNRKQNISLVMMVHDNQTTYGLTSLLNVVNELISHIGLYHTDYLHQQLGVPEE